MQPSFELPIDIPPRGSRDVLRALHRQLRAAIVDGRLQPGLRLPPTRALASTYGVSRNTAVATYDLLLSEGYLSARRGAGTYVAKSLPAPPVRKPTRAAPASEPRLNAFWRDPPIGETAPAAEPPRFDFRLGVPDQGAFAFTVWRRLQGRALRALAKTSAAYSDPQGRDALRSAIARHVSFARAVACRPDDLVVTTGAQQAFDLLARILVTRDRTVVAVEDPGYPPMRAALAAAGANIVPVPVDAEGLMVERLPRNARVICVTPSHQFPLGSVLSTHRRAALLQFAQRHEAVIIEDDYDGEFRFGERPLDALQTLDRAESVFYVGTFSKCLFPAIRLGFVVAPPWARRALVAAKRVSDCHCEVAVQDTLASFIAEGHLARHVRKMRRIYAERREALLDGLRRDFRGALEPIPAAAGLHLSAFADASVNVLALVQRARQHGIGIGLLRDYYSGKAARAGLVFGYGAIETRAIREGLMELRRLWRAKGGER
jgi:GntR family transcriptional regulator/MocR family aminotransferase